MSKNYIICQKCKTNNLNTDYCNSCGELINILLKRKLERQAHQAKVDSINSSKPRSKWIIKFEELRQHPNIFVRLIMSIIYAIGFVIMSIAALIGAIVSALAG